MEAIDVRKLVIAWIEKIGSGEVEKKLIDRGVPVSTRLRLVKGYYPNEPTGVLRATLIDELQKAGILSQEKEPA